MVPPRAAGRGGAPAGERALHGLSHRSRNPSWLRHGLGYAVAVVSVAIATGLTLAIGALRRESPFLLFTVAVMAATGYGGLRAGVAAVLLSLSITYFLYFDPEYTLLLDNASDLIPLFVFGFVGFSIAWHVTLLRRSRQQAQEAGERLHRAFADARIGFAVTDLQGGLLEVNRGFCEIVGYSETELAGRELRSLVDPQCAEEAAWFIRRIAASNVPSAVYETRYLHKGGSIVWVRISAAAVLSGPAGPPLNIVMLVEDITASVHAQVVLRESEARFRDLLININLIAMTIDTVGAITFCNPYLLRLTGYAPEEVLGKNWFDIFIPQEDREGLHSLFSKGIGGSSFPVHHENAIVTREGARRMISWDNTILRNAAGEVIGCASVGRDTTDRLLLEERYRQAQKLESVGRLAGGVAHDFNNLLTVINGYAETLVSSEPENSARRRPLSEIRKAGERAANLTRQLLAFSRKQLIQPKRLDINSVITDVESMLHRLIGEDIQVHVDLTPSLPPVMADAGQLQQVVMNLAVNARDAMPRGGKLTARTTEFETAEGGPGAPASLAPARYVVLEMSDTGIGMDSATREHLFEPFFTTKDKSSGTGLGLATVYGIVTQADGFITVESEPGHGASLRIFLPAAVESGPPQVAVKSGSGRLQGAEVVLIAEDNEGLRELACDILRSFGYTVLEAQDAAQALQIASAREGPIDVLITDVIMPGLNGRELAERLKTLRPEIKVLLMSGYTDDILSRHQVLDAGLEFLEKPFTPQALAAKVRNILES